MQLFSSNVEAVSVTISWATISTAWFSRWCFLTKASLARTAAPAPSDVGLMRGQTGMVGLRIRGITSHCKDPNPRWGSCHCLWVTHRVTEKVSGLYLCCPFFLSCIQRTSALWSISFHLCLRMIHLSALKLQPCNQRGSYQHCRRVR